MDQLVAGISYLAENLFSSSASTTSIAQLFLEHVMLTGVALALAVVIGVPLGILIARRQQLRGPVLAILGVVYTIPSLAMFVLLLMVFGIGALPAIIALVAYAQLVIVRNTLVGLTDIEPSIIEAAHGMGMSSRQQLMRVELPLALPMILAGVRLAAISIIGIGTIAAFINAGGLGDLLFTGILTGNQSQIIAGSIAISVLAIGVNMLLRALERRAAIAAGAAET
jgi:osmoprotectant transport system permease protein